MSTMQNPQLNGLKDVAVSAIVNVFDAYGWPILVTALAVLFLGVLLLVCYWTEFELIEFESMSDIYRFVRSSWRKVAKGSANS